MDDISAYINQLSPEKQELLELLISEAATEFNCFPLSFAQQRLWFVEQLNPNTSTYNIFAAVQLTGLLNVTVLHESVNEIVRRHEALRTTFTTIKNQPMQLVASAISVNLPVVDLRKLPQSEQDAEVQKLALAEAQQPFDLTKSPLLRMTLLQLSEEKHILLLTMHHIISDGWSIGVFVRQLAALYSSFLDGKSSPLPELPIQYADFAHWQREWLQKEVLEQHLCYWQQQLGEHPPVLELPTDRPRPAVQTFRGARHPLMLPQSLTEALKALSYQEKSTLFMTLLCAFKVLLYRWCGQDDILVGTPIANRAQAETEELIGCFVNALALRTNLGGNPSFRELLRRVRQVALEAYAHQDMPFEKLVEAIQSERDTSRNPLFQVMFALQNAPMPALKLPGLDLRLLDIESSTAKFDLTLELTEMPEGIGGFFEYNTDLFDPCTIQRMAGHFQTLLEGIVTNPEQRLWDLPLLTTEQRQTLLVEWNNTKVDYPHQCIHHLFEAQVERSPDTMAVVCEGSQLAYHELNQRANQLAHYLQRLGVGPDVLVGIYMERSLEMVVGLLGILKAGGAYVPIDPMYPKEQLAFILEDAQLPVLLTQEKLKPGLPFEIHNPTVVCLDTDWKVIEPESRANPVSCVTPEHLVYTIYTSGSTGKPKGVEVQHTGLANLVTWYKSFYKVTPTDRATHLAGPAFDASVLELWSNLIAGASIYIPDEDTRHSPSKLLQWLSAKAITICFLPTPLAEVVLAQELPEDLSLRFLSTGGDKLHRIPDKLSFSVVNLYGPTESTVIATAAIVSDLVQTDAPPIGRPIANTRVYILDARMQVVPIGVPGELYIAGVGLARGYLNRPELTAERFILNPFSNDLGDRRLYKTGDLARYLPDGNIEFLGRNDFQVKVRGFRIELGAIETALAQHPNLRENTVVTREDQPGVKRLVAYIVPKQDRAPTTSELRRFLKQKLPDYMVPSVLVILDTLPMTPNGKVNRRALPVPEGLRPELEQEYLAPRTLIEQVLADIWSQVLGIERVGIQDNFFALGGHSLLATQLVTQIRETLEVELPLRNLFEAPTIADLAAAIETIQQKSQNVQALPILPITRDKSLPLSFAQQRLWFIHQLDPNTTAYNILAAVQMTGSLNVTALHESLNEVVRRHEALRTAFATVEGQPVQVIAPNLTVTLPLVDLQQLPKDVMETEVQRIAQQEAQQCFDLASGSLLRGMLLQLDEQKHVLLLVIHHIVCDGWSMGVLIQELATLYEAFSSGKSPLLPKLSIQYADFAYWQRQWLQGDVLETQLAYWQQQLAGAPPVLKLPTDRSRPSVQNLRGAFQSFELSPSLTQRIKLLSQQSGTTLFMTLLTAFQTLLWYYSGQDDISVGSPVANRNRKETEPLIGFFVNTLVLRTNLSGHPSFRELLNRVKQVALGAYAHQDVPFEKLVETLQPERSSSYTPLFQVWFVLQNTPMPSLQLPDLNMTVLDLNSGMVRHDLKLGLWESETLQGLFEYKTDLFDASTIVQMAECFETLLETVVEQPDMQLDTLAKIFKDAQLQQQSEKEKEIEKTSVQKLKKVKRKALSSL
ncbi:amino acid adenylation domain-containing protein [Scytonema sp. UIC 10036]|uniref:non-ribosomal peptide synthetase n=1 Tax=Scytonema sp. UIC 10036 TaxID=2304196 RepID=UPI0012DAC46D|nr:non-ribosomal peptide synthetase [Scytonema sp. UIC 10036]MUG96209.1 amino acid adenylation domain-containing protein [Scytonema sp. UIC 10036]